METLINIGDDKITVVHKGQGFTVSDTERLKAVLGRIDVGSDVEVAYDTTNIVSVLAADAIDALLSERNIGSRHRCSL